MLYNKISHEEAARIWLIFLFGSYFAILGLAHTVLSDRILKDIDQSLSGDGTALQVLAFHLLLYLILGFFGRNDSSC